MSEDLLSKVGPGFLLKASDHNFMEGIEAVVDYRGDVTIALKNGNSMVGYVYSSDAKSLDMFPRDSSRKERVFFADIIEIEFSGENTAKGKSWEDWASKKSSERAALKAQAVETSL